jgi:hypothetical protein
MKSRFPGPPGTRVDFRYFRSPKPLCKSETDGTLIKCKQVSKVKGQGRRCFPYPKADPAVVNDEDINEQVPDS